MGTVHCNERAVPEMAHRCSNMESKPLLFNSRPQPCSPRQPLKQPAASSFTTVLLCAQYQSPKETHTLTHTHTHTHTPLYCLCTEMTKHHCHGPDSCRAGRAVHHRGLALNRSVQTEHTSTPSTPSADAVWTTQAAVRASGLGSIATAQGALLQHPAVVPHEYSATV